MTLLTKKILADTKYLRLLNKEYLVDGEFLDWSYVERTTSKEGVPDAVVIFAYDLKRKKVLTINEFRYSVGDYVLDLPAGLVENGLSVEETALKELKEETGYTGKIVKVLPPSYSSVGLTTEQVSVVFIEVDSTDTAEQNLEGTEVITSNWVNIEDIDALLESNAKVGGRAQLTLFFAKDYIKNIS